MGVCVCLCVLLGICTYRLWLLESSMATNCPRSSAMVKEGKEGEQKRCMRKKARL